MKVHLRLTEKDVDLCRWRHSVKKRMFTYYVSQILLSEMRGEIAYLPTALSVSARKEPCEVYMNFTDSHIVEYLQTFPEFRRNATLKKIIRKHLQSQSSQVEKKVVYQSKMDTQTSVETRPRVQKKIKLEDEKPVQTVSKKEIVESEEDRAAILALIAMGGE